MGRTRGTRYGRSKSPREYQGKLRVVFYLEEKDAKKVWGLADALGISVNRLMKTALLDYADALSVRIRRRVAQR